jgi:predicted HAD superfamily hydrolase
MQSDENKSRVKHANNSVESILKQTSETLDIAKSTPNAISNLHSLIVTSSIERKSENERVQQGMINMTAMLESLSLQSRKGFELIRNSRGNINQAFSRHLSLMQEIKKLVQA